jgi:hypothetical protein
MKEEQAVQQNRLKKMKKEQEANQKKKKKILGEENYKKYTEQRQARMKLDKERFQKPDSTIMTKCFDGREVQKPMRSEKQQRNKTSQKTPQKTPKAPQKAAVAK